jgi:hypothetical protein
MRKLAPWLVALGCVTACAGLGYFLVLLGRPPAGAAAEQERIVAEIHVFRDRHGRLPDSLQEAGIEFDRNTFDFVGYWKLFDNPNEFTLSCCKDYWNPTPRMHWWYYQSDRGTWEYETEGY